MGHHRWCVTGSSFLRGRVCPWRGTRPSVRGEQSPFSTGFERRVWKRQHKSLLSFQWSGDKGGALS